MFKVGMGMEIVVAATSLVENRDSPSFNDKRTS